MKKRQSLGMAINEGKGNIDVNGVKLGGNGSVDLDLVTGKEDEELDSWVHHLKLCN